MLQPTLVQRPVPKPYLLVLLTGIIACTAAACSVGTGVRSLFGETVDVHVTVDETANDEFPLAMDLVCAYDDETLTKLLQMTAKEWFDQRAAFLNGEGKEKLESWGWEWTPGHDTTVSVPLKGSVSGAVVFVNYFTSGQHRVRVEPNHDFRVTLGFDDFTVAPM